jgi:hypothetical protein
MGQQMYGHDAILNTKNILSTRAPQDFMHVCIRQMIYKGDVIKIDIENLTYIPDFNLCGNVFCGNAIRYCEQTHEIKALNGQQKKFSHSLQWHQ